MSSKMDNRVNNSRGISNKKNKRQLSPREKLEIKKKLRRKELLFENYDIKDYRKLI